MREIGSHDRAQAVRDRNDIWNNHWNVALKYGMPSANVEVRPIIVIIGRLAGVTVQRCFWTNCPVYNYITQLHVSSLNTISHKYQVSAWRKYSEIPNLYLATILIIERNVDDEICHVIDKILAALSTKDLQ